MFRVSREVIDGVISRVTIATTHIRRLVTPLITTHEPLKIYLRTLLAAEDSVATLEAQGCDCSGTWCSHLLYHGEHSC